MTFLERDKEKIEEGIELTKKVFKLSIAGVPPQKIAEECDLTLEQVENILN